MGFFVIELIAVLVKAGIADRIGTSVQNVSFTFVPHVHWQQDPFLA